jgi:hypothetical protein
MNNIEDSSCERNYRSSQDLQLGNKRYDQICQFTAKITQHKRVTKSKCTNPSLSYQLSLLRDRISTNIQGV